MCRINEKFNCLLKMQKVLLTICCCFSYGVRAQAPNTPSTLALLPQSQSNWEDFTTSHQALKDAAKTKKDKFTCVLNLLKNALAEELENSQCQITEETIQESALSSITNILEEEQLIKEYNEDLEKQGITNQNKTDDEKALYQKIITKIASAFSKSQNTTNKQDKMEMPSMIPIFKQRPNVPRSELCQNTADFSAQLKEIPKSRAVSFVPKKIIQTNINHITSSLPFNIPCQRAADVLDMSNIAIPKEPVHAVQLSPAQLNVKPNISPVVESPKPNLPNHVPAPVTLSVNCADSDDTIAMLFKPKNISLMQLYGNLLKKITITVLVPYHMSKLGQS